MVDRRADAEPEMDAKIYDALATELLDALDRTALLPPITACAPGFGVADAYEVGAEIVRRRCAGGERPIGRKLGFTNRTIWSEYGLSTPFWAHIYDRTVTYLDATAGSVAIGHLAQPRLEPEIVLHFWSAPPVTTDEAELLSHIDWIAHGFEIVQSHFPDWKFSAADCSAAFGLHGALVVGTPVPLTGANRAALAAALPTFKVTLSRGDAVIDRGVGSNVLDSPALALAHLARLLADQPQAPKLAAGEIVTTGTITDAWPVAAGEVWSSDYGVLGLEGLTLRFTVSHPDRLRPRPGWNHIGS